MFRLWVQMNDENGSASFRASHLLMLAWVLLFFMMSCSEDGEKTFEADGDEELMETETDTPDSVDGAGDTPNQPLPDGDEETYYEGDRERPEAENVIWDDDSYDEWSGKEFCSNGEGWTDDFEDENFSENPAWVVDKNVDDNPTGLESSVIKPEILECGEGRGFCVSGDAGDTGDVRPPARLYREIDPDATAYTFDSFIKTEGAFNMFYLDKDDDPTDDSMPYFRLRHELSEGGGERIVVLDVVGEVGCEIQFDTNQWRRIVLYRLDKQTWRMDVNRGTVCEAFTIQNQNDFPYSFLHVGRKGRYDRIGVGKHCEIPPVSFGCERSSDCPFESQICGRDGVCHEARAITCNSDWFCDGRLCVGEKDDGDFLGDGVCTQTCEKHSDCLASEVCFPHSATEGTCHTLCEEGGRCPEGQTCMESAGVWACQVDNCKEHAQWQRWRNLLVCRCTGDYSENPQTGVCTDYGSCADSIDCGYERVCGGGICHKSRANACETDEQCHFNTACLGFEIGGFLEALGICTMECALDSECLAYEHCVPMTEQKWACLQTCNADSECLQPLTCLSGFSGQGFCMPQRCQELGSWQWSEAAQAYRCVCDEGLWQDPASGRCQAY